MTTIGTGYDSYQVEEFATDVQFPEGPGFLPDGTLFVSEMRPGLISRFAADGSREVLADVGGTPNGVVASPDGYLYYCQGGSRVWGPGTYPYPWPGAAQLLLPAPDGPRSTWSIAPSICRVPIIGGAIETVVEGVTDGSSFCMPSDITVDEAGNLYFTDAGEISAGQLRLGGVWFIEAGTSEAKPVVTMLNMANGIVYSSEERALFVAETRSGKVWRFELDGPGHAGARRCITSLTTGGPFDIGGCDGVGLGRAGELMVAALGAGNVAVMDSSTGEISGRIDCRGELLVTNVIMRPGTEDIYITLATTAKILRARRQS